MLKHGIELSNMHLDLMYSRPATTFNKELNVLYDKNIFSASEEVWASDTERIDVVIFLNGLAIMTFELKANTAGQNYRDAIYQYRTDRDPKTRLFRFKAGALVNFAMDLEEVYMTTKLDGPATYFLPFNMGHGEGINTGAGNPIYEDQYSVHYMWDNILTKDSLVEIITKFMFIEVKESLDEKTGKRKSTETVIFPRYHQLDVLRKVLADVKENKTAVNYLLQHSAGSGKTNEIAWLAHRLASLHDADNIIIFDNIIICTDRVVVDRQLQQAVLAIEHKSGFIRVILKFNNYVAVRLISDNPRSLTAFHDPHFPNSRKVLRRLGSDVACFEFRVGCMLYYAAIFKSDIDIGVRAVCNDGRYASVPTF